MSGKGVVRSIKNYAKGFSDIQIKVREATSNDAWGPSGTLMNEIAQATYNQQDFIEVMDMIDRRLNDKGKNWRHVFKALLLLDYCIHVGSENVVLYAKENLYVVKTLKEFQHIDDGGKDVGANVRQKAKDITSLLLDDARLNEERHKRTQMKDRMTAVGDYMNETILDGRHANGENMYERPRYLDEDGDLRKAIEESKQLAQEEARKQAQGDEDLAKALQLSEQEARDKEQSDRAKWERENEQNLFGASGSDTQMFQGIPQNQFFSQSANPYSQQQQQQQWPQNTGMTGFSFSDPLTSQQPMHNQQTGFTNPYQQQQSFPQSIQAQMTGMPQQQQSQYSGMSPFQTTTQLQQQNAGMPSFQATTTTGTNPFSQKTPNQPAQQNTSILQPQQTGFSMETSAFSQYPSSTSAQQTITGPQLASSNPTGSGYDDPRYAKLNSLLENREDGMDTFGNTGNLRVPFGTGYASTLKPESNQARGDNNDNNTMNNNATGSPSFSQSFGQQPSRNPFGTGNSSPSSAPNNKSLMTMMAEQNMLQQNQPFQQQMTGFQQPQSTGIQQPQMTGLNQNTSYPQQSQQQRQSTFNQQSGSFF
ncbi:hypothetical protein BCR42DRAFT_487768 [Absidia repens]|uniref:ENTH domain-containing protein n=1 Tax=Absidia repens TaxID=90262 RepID=A0A1X2ITS2_9FUNG|nr:hypothetical protein BCR42DRAFT_487768 [Absidia repens]